MQQAASRVPTVYGDRIFFGPCKKPMRPRIKSRDYVFGVSDASMRPRRLVFAAQVEKCITFREAYHRYPDLHGPQGPIHVRPINGSGSFPCCSYEHIPGAIHPDDWETDLASPTLDAFLVCAPRSGCVGRWLGAYGPVLDEEVYGFLQTCSAHGQAGLLSERNTHASLRNPIAYGRLYTGLHLETAEPEILRALCKARMTATTSQLDRVPVPAVTCQEIPSSGCGCGGTSRAEMCQGTTRAQVSRICRGRPARVRQD